MRRNRFVSSAALAVAGAVLLTGSAASAFVLDPVADKAALGLRNDVAKQGSGLTACLVKAVTACEKGSDPLSPDCLISAPGDCSWNAKACAKFVAAVPKCFAKVSFAKKVKAPTTSAQAYQSLGCPGDCDPDDDGPQACTDLETWEAAEEAFRTTLVEALAGLIPGFTTNGPSSDCLAAGTALTINGPVAKACCTSLLDGTCVEADDPGSCIEPAAPSDPPTADELKAQAAFKKCVETKVGLVSALAQGIIKCQAACEQDYKNKKGNGGPTDSLDACALGAATDPGGIVGSAPADANFKACVGKLVDKAIKKGPLPAKFAIAFGLLGESLPGQLNGINSALYNAPDNCM
jgi:hypothetical protein